MIKSHEEPIIEIGDFAIQPTNVVVSLKALYVHCPKHGTHPHSIQSTVGGHEGAWCLICWTESLGPSLPSEMLPLDNENGGSQNDD